ncbi:hypothetical protein QYE76_056263 [Lolium multiflorum]|uniref:Arabidopsis retrotransposon Orf1 C-terminal domain-containing protein n=1 Tax=Lolium multiflorum TaxID=4521 RepID=A0AAD8T1V2_LOLMU|nr:hypothetical protein QYE76_056263 [Lolium multiflorum]
MLDTAVGGTFMSKPVELARRLLDDMQSNHAQWHVDRSSSRKVNAITEGNNEELTSKVDDLIHMLKGKPEPNPVEDLKMMRIERNGEALEELDYSNSPTPEYSVEDLIKMVTIIHPGVDEDEHEEPLAVAALAALPVEDTPASLGIEFEDQRHLNRFNHIKDHEIKSKKWACPYILNQLGLRDDFNTLCNNVGLLDFCFQEVATYRRLTLEFLSTLKHTVNHYYNTKDNQPGVDRISFRLMNREMRVRSTLPRGNSIECPTILYLYYVIANTLQTQGDFTKLNEEDMMILGKAGFPESNLLPNLGAILVLYLNHQALEARGPICGGGVITVMESMLIINGSNLRELEGPRRLGFTTLNACGMVRKIEGRYYFNIPGADHLIAAPLRNGLSLEERRLHYDAHVEENLPPQQDEPEGEEEVEQEPQGPEQEQQPLHDFTTYQDMYALEGSIENLSNLAINLRDNATKLNSQFTHWSSQWNYGNYPPPQ